MNAHAPNCRSLRDTRPSDFGIECDCPAELVSPATYATVDKHTGTIVGRATTLKAARRRADKLDNAYGAYRYGVREASA